MRGGVGGRPGANELTPESTCGSEAAWNPQHACRMSLQQRVQVAAVPSPEGGKRAKERLDGALRPELTAEVMFLSLKRLFNKMDGHIVGRATLSGRWGGRGAAGGEKARMDALADVGAGRDGGASVVDLSGGWGGGGGLLLYLRRLVRISQHHGAAGRVHTCTCESGFSTRAADIKDAPKGGCLAR